LLKRTLLFGQKIDQCGGFIMRTINNKWKAGYRWFSAFGKRNLANNIKIPRNVCDIAVISLGFFFVVLLIGDFLLENFCHSRTIDNDYAIAIQDLCLINEDDASKVVFFGSSMAREGIDRRYLEDEFKGYRFYNFSFSSGKPSDFYFIFSKIKQKENIKLAVITISPWVFQKRYTDDLTRGTDVFTSLLFDPFVFYRIADWRDTDRSWLLRQSIFYVMPLYRYGDYLHKIFDHQNISFWKTKSERAVAETWIPYKYWENKPESYFAEELGKESNYEEYRNSNYYWDKNQNIQMKSLEILVREMEEKSIPVIIVDMPVNPYKQNIYEDGLVSNYVAGIDLLAPRSRFVDYSFVYSRGNFIDFNHLNADGRFRFSRDLRELIKNEYGL